MLTQSCSVLLQLLTLNSAAVTSTNAALTLWSGSLASPPIGPSMHLKYPMTLLTTCFGSHHLDGCNKHIHSILTRRGWRGCVFGTGSRQSSPGFLSTEAGGSPGENCIPAPFLTAPPNAACSPPCKKAPLFTLYLELGQCSEPAGVISTLILCEEGGNRGSGKLSGRTQRHLLYSNST